MGTPVGRFLMDREILPARKRGRHPRVSVILPTYRLRPGGKNRRAVESVLAQTMGDLELILVEDGPNDGLRGYLDEVYRADDRVVLIRHENNCGLHAVRLAEGLLLAQGDTVAYMFEDDEWLPDCLNRLEGALKSNPDSPLAYGVAEWNVEVRQGEFEQRWLGEWNFNYSSLMGSNKIANCAVLHTRKVLSDVGLYDPHILLRRLCDYDLWLRMARRSVFARCDEVVARVWQDASLSIGASVDQDLVVCRRYMASFRDRMLAEDRILRFEVDALGSFPDTEDRNNVQEHFVIPFWESHPEYLRPEERPLKLVTSRKPLRVLITKPDFSTSVEVAFGHNTRLLPREVASATYLSESDVRAARPWNFDMLALHRTIGASSLEAARAARQHGKSIAYWMDDNMLRFGTGSMRSEFDYLAPGSVGYEGLVKQVAMADGVVSYSDQITTDVKEINPRVFQLRTAMPWVHVAGSAIVPDAKGKRRRRKYAILTGPIRSNELARIWPQVSEFARRHADEVEFHLWGFDATSLPRLEAPTRVQEFLHSYEHYLDRLRAERFDFVLCPLDHGHPAKRSKSPVKFLEITVAGAVGIYSKSPVYEPVVDGLNGYVVEEEESGWLIALERSLLLTEAQRRSLHGAAKDLVLRDWTSEGGLLRYLSVLEATALHAKLESHARPGGRSTIAYFVHEPELGGATLHVMQHARIARQFQLEPILCLSRLSDVEGNVGQLAKQEGMDVAILDFQPRPWIQAIGQEESRRVKPLRDWLGGHKIGFVHMTLHSPEVCHAAAELGIPVLLSLHQPPGSPVRPNNPPGPRGPAHGISAIHCSSHQYGRVWMDAAGVPSFCIRAPIEDRYFQTGQDRLAELESGSSTIMVAGTLQDRKGQLEAIRAVGLLRRQGVRVRLVLIGYAKLRTDYTQACRRAIKEEGVGGQVEIRGFVSDPLQAYAATGILLCSSTQESMPQSVLTGMASGCLVVTTPIGGIRELIRDGFSGIVTAGTSSEEIAAGLLRALQLSAPQRTRVLQTAFREATMCCSQDLVAYRLLKLYNLAAEMGLNSDRHLAVVRQENRPEASQSEIPVSLAVSSSPSRIRQVVTLPRRLTSRGLSYRIKAVRPGWNRLRIWIATYKKPASGVLHVDIYQGSTSSAPIRAIEVPLVNHGDHMPVTIEFPAIEASSGVEFEVRFHVSALGTGSRMALLEDTASPTFARRIARRLSRKGESLTSHLQYQAQVS